MEKEIRQIAEFVREGEINPLEAFFWLKEIEILLTQYLEEIKPAAIREAEKYGRGQHKEYGVLFSVREAGTVFQFNESDEWKILKAQIKELEEKLKSGYLDTETGELYPKVSRKSTTSIFITRGNESK